MSPHCYIKIQHQSFLGSGEEGFKSFLPYIGMAAILFNGAEPFEQIDDTPSIGGPMWNLLKISPAVSEKFKDYGILYMNIALGQGYTTPVWHSSDCNWKGLLLWLLIVSFSH